MSGIAFGTALMAIGSVLVLWRWPARRRGDPRTVIDGFGGGMIAVGIGWTTNELVGWPGDLVAVAAVVAFLGLYQVMRRRSRLRRA